MPFGIDSVGSEVARVVRSLPLLAEVQQHLSALPEVMSTIGTGSSAWPR